MGVSKEWIISPQGYETNLDLTKANWGYEMMIYLPDPTDNFYFYFFKTSLDLIKVRVGLGNPSVELHYKQWNAIPSSGSVGA